MKTFVNIKSFLLTALIIVATTGRMKASNNEASIDATITYQDFYDALSPHGNWIEYPGYGHAWNPTIDGYFRPYLTNGYWDYSDQGWMWASNYDWGWAPFHYGSWFYDNSYGWLWVPGYEWSPAWVTWGDFDDYYAWAPLTPLVNVGFAYSSWRPNSEYWNIVGRNQINDRNIYREVLPRVEVNNYVNRINVINNFNKTANHNHYYASGPQVKEVEKYTKKIITPASIKEVKKPAVTTRKDNAMHIYKPVVSQPQPRTYKRATTPQIERNFEKPQIEKFRQTKSKPMELNRDAQMKLIQNLPQYKAPQNTFKSSVSRNGNSGKKRN